MRAARLAARLMAGLRRWLIAPLAVVALAATFVVDIPAAHAACANPIVCENQLPGTPQSIWDVSTGDGTTIQGFADPFSVNIGRLDQLQDRVTGKQLYDRYLPDRLLRRGRRAPNDQHHAEHLGVAEPASLQHQHRNRPGRLRQLGCVRDLERPDQRPCPGSTSRTSTGPTAAATRTRSLSW